jgi:hypothetical protein
LERVTITHIICENCEGYYELQPEEALEDFDSCQCGGILRYVEEDYFQSAKVNEIVREIRTNGKTYKEQKISNYTRGIITGALMGFIGLIGWITNYNFLTVLLLLGPMLSVLSYNKSRNWIKGAEGERIVFEYLNELPQDYYILNDVTIPSFYGNIDHVVIGPTGIFVIETKNFSGSYTIDEDNWFYGSGSNAKEAYHNPGEQIKANHSALINFLSSEGLNSVKNSTHALVAFINPNLTIRNKPKHYDVLHPSNICSFILSRKNKIKESNVEHAVQLLRHYSVEISYYGHYEGF